MLSRLYIENIAVIEKCEIAFNSGLNILTGETGAGKSIIINALKAVLGQKVSKDIVRSGCEKAFVSAIFFDISDENKEHIKNFDIPLEDDSSIIIEREITLSGKTICKINSRPATLSLLKDIGERLINIHGQYETYGLLSEDSHIKYIDSMGNLGNCVTKYSKVFSELNSLISKLRELSADDSSKARRVDLLKYQISEIEAANITVSEEDKLNLLKNTYLNSEKISMHINRVKEVLGGTDSSLGAVCLVKEAADKLLEISELLPQATDIAQRTESVFYEIDDCLSELTGISDIPQANPEELENIESRLDVIYKLKTKYGQTEEDISNFLESAKKELKSIEFSEEMRLQLKEEISLLKDKAIKMAKGISEKRHIISKQFESKVKKELEFLNMPTVKLNVCINRTNLTKSGCDNIVFLISTNAGEEPKSIAKIASGGELSRIMLAIKTVLARNDNIDTLIFDEVDAGISGSTAQKVGLKLKEVSKNRQIICITHLAQIASLADIHLLIKKDTVKNKTYTSIKNLDYDDRVLEVARIIGGIETTPTTIKAAKEMICRSGR